MPVVLVPLPTPPDAHSDDPLGLVHQAADAEGQHVRVPDPVWPDIEEEDLVEAAAGSWTSVDALKHPRWPKGMPGGLGGEFMHVGETFDFDGHTWEVSSIVAGPDGEPQIIVHEASGKYSKVQTRIIDPTKTGGAKYELTGAKRSETRKIKGGKTGSDVTIVDPYVDHASHDPSIPIPATSDFTAEEWARFGRAEQLHYTDLQNRYGKHGSVAASNLIGAAYAESENETANLVSSAFDSQYKGSSGFSLSITKIFRNFVGHPKELEATRKKREKALELQGRIRDAYAWDLYNRLHAPDIAIFHKDKNGHGTSWWKSKFIGGANPVFSGLSQSHHFRSKFWSSQTGLATPTSIRHVVMATVSAPPLKSGKSGFDSYEKEMAIGHQMRVDDRSMSFDNQEIMKEYRDWLEGQTENGAGGEILASFRGAHEHGEHLDIPPPKAHIQMGNADAFQPPAAAGEAMAEYGDQLPDGGVGHWKGEAEDLKAFALPWATTDANGVPVATTAEDYLPKLGDFVMGKQGTLYWVGPDNSNESPLDLRIYKLIPDGSGGLKYANESWAYKPGFPNYVLKGNVPLEKTKEARSFDPDAWVPTDADPTPISQLHAGDKFKVNGTVYEITSSPGTSLTSIKDLEHGGTGSINSAYQALVLIPKPDYVPAKQYLAPKPGLTLAYEGKKHIVTSVKKDGTVSIKPSTGGLVVPLAPDATELTDLFDPKGWEISKDQTPLSALKVGDIFHGGRGKVTLRPHRIEKIEGNTVHWTNLDTGAPGESKLSKKVKVLVSTDVASTSGHDTPPGPPEVTPVPTAPVPSGTPIKSTQDMQYGESTLLAALKKGDLFTLPDAPNLKYQVLDIDQNPDNGAATYKIAGVTPDGGYTAPTNMPASVQIHFQGLGSVSTAPPPPATYHGYEHGQLVSMKKFNGGTWEAEVIGQTTTPKGHDALIVKKGTKEYTVTLAKVVTEPNLPDPPTPDGTPADPDTTTKDYQQASEHSQAVDDLPSQSDSFAAYKSAYGSGGKYKHNRLNEMPAGTVFQDKSGKLYKIQVVGPTPIVTDGATNFTLNGNMRGRALPDATMGGPPPPVSTASAPTPTEEYVDPKPNMTLGDAGDKYGPLASAVSKGLKAAGDVDPADMPYMTLHDAAEHLHTTPLVHGLAHPDVALASAKLAQAGISPGDVPDVTDVKTENLLPTDTLDVLGFSLLDDINAGLDKAAVEAPGTMTLQKAADHLGAAQAATGLGTHMAITTALNLLKYHDITPKDAFPALSDAADEVEGTIDVPPVEFVAFEDVPLGERLWVHGAIWEKIGPSTAKVVDAQGGPAPFGTVEDFMFGTSVGVEASNPAHPAHVEGSMLVPNLMGHTVDDLEVGSHYTILDKVYMKVTNETQLDVESGVTSAFGPAIAALKPQKVYVTPQAPPEAPDPFISTIDDFLPGDSLSTPDGKTWVVVAQQGNGDKIVGPDEVDQYGMTVVKPGTPISEIKMPSGEVLATTTPTKPPTPESALSPNPMQMMVDELPVGSTYKLQAGPAFSTWFKISDSQVMQSGGEKIVVTPGEKHKATVPGLIDTATPPPPGPLGEPETSGQGLFELEPGDEFENLDGHPFQMVTTKGDSQAIYKDLESGQLGEAYEMSNTDGILPIPASDAPPSPDYDAVGEAATANAKADADNIIHEAGGLENIPKTTLQGFKSSWGSGGKYKHPYLKDMTPGQKFRDTANAHYVFVEAVGGGMVLIYRANSGEAFLTSAKQRVRELD